MIKAIAFDLWKIKAQNPPRFQHITKFVASWPFLKSSENVIKNLFRTIQVRHRQTNAGYITSSLEEINIKTLCLQTTLSPSTFSVR